MTYWVEALGKATKSLREISRTEYNEVSTGLSEMTGFRSQSCK